MLPEINLPQINPNDLVPVVIVFVTTIVAFYIFRAIVFRQLTKLATNGAVKFFLDQVRDINLPIAVVSAIYLASKVAPGVSDSLANLLYLVFTITWLWQFIQLANGLVDVMIKRLISKSSGADAGNAAIYRFLGNALKFIVWILAVLLLLSNLGVDVNSLIAGLGVTGIAVALAVQSLLGDVINSFSLVTDKPFKTNDFIILGEYMGTVEKIGVKSTRIRALDGEELVVPNSELVSKIVRNYGNIDLRRALHKIGVTYETPQDQLAQIPSIINEILKDHPDIQDDSYRTHLISYGDFSIDYEIQFFVKTADYDKFLDIQQEVLFSIGTRFAENGIEFAYPTQVVYTKQ